MIATIVRLLEEEIRARVLGLFELELEEIPLTRPPRAELGDLATPVALEIAKKLEKSPRLIACELASRILLPPGIDQARVEKGGYINFRFRRGEIGL